MQLFRKSKVDDIFQQQQEKIEREKQEIENLKLACSEVFSSTNGKYVLRFLKKISGWSEQDMNINTDVLAYKKGRRDSWLILRNLLPKDIIAQIEIYDEAQ